jgi:chromate transporter
MMSNQPLLPDPNRSTLARLIEIAKLFLKLGTISFGGPVAHIAMMEDEVVRRRQWLSREHFLDLLGATNLIPGPNSTEMAIHIGWIYGGWWGLILAGWCFILPATILTTAFGWIYVTYGALPQIAPLLYGIKPAVLGIVVDALWRLGKKAIKNRKLFIIALVVAMIVKFYHLNEVLAILLGGLLGGMWLQQPDRSPPSDTSAQVLIAGSMAGITLKASGAAVTASTVKISLWQLGWIFLKIGSLLFGGGYVLMAFLQADFVQERGWLTQQQLLDAIAIGQFTPGPILSTAAFVGYLLAGIPGAIVATVGIFLPSFVLVAALNPLIPRLRASKWTAACLDAVNVSALALIAVMAIDLGTKILLEPLDRVAIGIAIVSTVIAIRYQINPIWLLAGGAIGGWLGS